MLILSNKLKFKFWNRARSKFGLRCPGLGQTSQGFGTRVNNLVIYLSDTTVSRDPRTLLVGPVVDWVSDKIRESLTVSLMMNCYFIPNILLLQMPRGWRNKWRRIFFSSLKINEGFRTQLEERRQHKGYHMDMQREFVDVSFLDHLRITEMLILHT